MKRRSLLAVSAAMLLGLSARSAMAEPFTVSVPGKNFQLSFDIPEMDKFQGQNEGGRFKFFGQSEKSGVWLSFHVEPWEKASGGNKECRAEYWGKASKEPLIKQDTARITDTDRYSMVSYLIDGEYEKQKIKSSNVSFYFVYENSCVDVHVSKFPWAEGDDKIVTAVGDTLKWGPKGKK